MAIATIPGGLYIPRITTRADTGIVYTGFVLDAAAERYANIFRIPKTGTVSHLHFRTNAVTTSTTLDIRLETVSAATGDPTGTLYAVNANGAQGTLAANTWYRVALTAAAAVTRGDLVALVVANSGTGNLSVAAVTSPITRTKFPYGDHFTASWTRNEQPMVCAVEYNDGSFATIPGLSGFSNLTTTTWNSGSTPDERGLKFRFPFPFRIAGVWAHLDSDNDCELRLYDSNGTTVLETVTIDAQQHYGVAGGLQNYLWPATRELLANTYYRVSVLPTTGSSVAMEHFDVFSAGIMDAHEGGQDFHLTTRTDAGAWTDVLTSRPFIGLYLDGFDAGGGTGGVRYHPGMGGGARG
jgi:hypothetical protein